jgi:hypothetical protein
MFEKICINCDKSFIVNYKSSTKKLCSNDCRYKSSLFKSRICNTCKIEKPREYFSESTGKKRRGTNIRSSCKDCLSRGLNITTVEQFIRRLFNGIKRRENKILASDLTVSYLISLYNDQKGLCNISKLPMTIVVGNKVVDTNISIDRIDNNKGYIKENIQLVCRRINSMKSDLILDNFYNWCELIIKNKEGVN